MLEITKEPIERLTELIQIRMTPSMEAEVSEHARKNDMERSEFIRAVLEAYMKQFEADSNGKRKRA